jgi:L-alanine-DL-glutamate epimerase-like enolase superfamily enzyme
VQITDVEAVVLRQAAVNEDIADGSQDDLVILISTDEGITGIGEVDSAPEAVKALVDQRGSHAVATLMRSASGGTLLARRNSSSSTKDP